MNVRLLIHHSPMMLFVVQKVRYTTGFHPNVSDISHILTRTAFRVDLSSIQIDVSFLHVLFYDTGLSHTDSRSAKSIRDLLRLTTDCMYHW